MYCPKCQLAYTTPYPSEETIGYLYDGRESFYNFDPITNSLIDKIKDVFANKELQFLSSKIQDKRGRRVLDYGTGNGRYAAVSSKLFPGASVDAVDYQQKPPTYLLETSVNYLYINDFWETDQQYDLIVLRHVLEHNHHPDKLLSGLQEHLAPGGVMYIEVPNVQSWYTRIASHWMNSFSVPYYLFHFSAASLRDLVTRCGMDCIIGYNEMPLMGGVFAAVTGLDRSLFTQITGIFLHPMQLVLSVIYGAPCVHAITHHSVTNPN